MQKKSTLMYATLAFMIASNTALAQQVITGKVTDGKQPIAGATVIIPGSKVGTSTDKDGNFSITAPKNNGQLEIKFIGHATQVVKFSNESPIETVILTPTDGESLEEIIIVGKSIIDVAEGRKTPIAVSTIKQQEIEEKVGGQDITASLANTPSVYIGGQAKGFGESSMTTRGFDQSNTAFLLNGQPINGMDNGRVYWSNWNGLQDISSLVQIQRGLGSSKLAISSVGGTTNFVTKSTDMKEGGFVKQSIGNDMYQKSTIAYNTGLMKNGFAVSAMFTNWSGNGYMNQTQGAGQNYFLSVGYKVNDNHNLNLMITGAPQWHNQGYTGRLSAFLENGRRYNDNIKTYNGVEMNPRKNYYHKPVANLNWDWKIDEKSSLGTVVYASMASGGGTAKYDDANKVPYLSSSVNNHQWYGIVSNYQRELNKNLSFNAGFDLRDYKGTHFRELTDLLGAPSISYYGGVNDPGLHTTSTTYSTNPWKAFTNYAKNKEERIGWDYNQYIRYAGLFGQIEYAKNGFTTFFQGSISEQQNRRTDYFQYTPGNQESEKINNFGYNVKGGASYSLGKHTIFANAGYYSRQPLQNNIFAFNSNVLNPHAKNEEILGLEAGYKFVSKYLDVAVNAYRTTWANRVTGSSSTATAADEAKYGSDKVTAGDFIYTTNYGVKQDHQGVELEFVTKPFSFVQVKGFASLGNWVYKGTTTAILRNENREELGTTSRDITGVKVGDAAQTSFGGGLEFFIIDGLSADADYRRYERLYGALPSNAPTLKLPDYDLVDAGISYRVKISEKNAISFRVNINNVFNTFYISDATSNYTSNATTQYWKGINTSNYVLIGQGRTWNGSVKFTF